MYYETKRKIYNDQKTVKDRVGNKLNAKCGCETNHIKELARAEWLIDMGLKESDIMWNEEDGKEYVMQEPNLMDEGEPEDGRMRKVYLPDEIQS